MDLASLALLLGGLALSVLAVLAAGLGRRQTARLREATVRVRSLEEELSSLRSVSVQLQKESQLLTNFVREFPQVASELHSEVEARRLPGLLLRVALRCFNPWQAVVLLRRRRVSTDPSRATRLVVAAVARPGQGIEPGMELALGEGLLGLAAEVQQLLTKQDLEREPTLARVKRERSDPLQRFEPDLVAPMVFQEETVGLIALSETAHVSDAAKGILRIVCQMGALAVHNASAYSEMKLTAQMDGLTRLYNKTHTTYILAERISQAEQRHAAVSIFLFDIDHFKHYNDTNGHDAGDRLLSELGRLVQENVRRTDVLGRFGGEEFLLVLPNTDGDQASTVAEKIRGRIAGYDFAFARNQPLGRVSVSGGVATYPADGLDSAGLLRAADQALYESKRGGRNRVTRVEPRHFGADAVDYNRSVLEAALERETARPEGTGA
jgi:diguanylate cyclase (GGDEF)-like protein